ncbi:MAG: hypothetical protein V3U73_07620 [bacterium]
MIPLRFILLIILLLIGASPNFAGDKPQKESSSRATLALQAKIYGEPFLKPFPAASNMTDESQDLSLTTFSHKSLPKGMFMSMLVPGTGELYAGSIVKGLLFLGIEAGAWVLYTSSHNKGMEWERRYIGFANQNWDEDRWQAWWNSLSAHDQEGFLNVELPMEKNSEYYEAIGVYEKFNAGWKDVQWNPGIANTTPSVESLGYNKWRQSSNSSLKWATSLSGIILANHLLSGLDAVWSVSRHNKNLKPSIKPQFVSIDGEPQLLAAISIEW